MRAVAVLVAAALGGCAPSPQPVPEPRPVPPSTAPQPDFSALERRHGARIGVFALDTGTGEQVAHRADERFAYASTVKALVVGVILRTDVDLDKVIPHPASELITHSPVTEKHTELTVRALCDAAVRYSDNTAANLLFRELGGPGAFGRAMRDLGDTTLHADRYEPDLNTAVPGDIRDTSTPRALATSLRAMAVDDALPDDKRAVLVDLMRRNTTGDKLIRSAAPAGWVVGDKTGTAAYGTRNDIAVLWPPGRPPIVLAVLTSHPDADADPDDALVAEAARIALTTLT